MSRYLKLCAVLVIWALVGCDGSKVIDLNFSLEAQAVSYLPSKRTTPLIVTDEPQAAGVINPFHNKSIDHNDVRMTIFMDSLTFDWRVSNNSTTTTRLGFNDVYCLDANNQEKLKLNVRSFKVIDVGEKKPKIFAVGTGAQNVEIKPGVTTQIRMIPSNMQTTLQECLKLKLDPLTTIDDTNLIGKEVSVSIPYENTGSSGKYILKFKIIDARSRTSYF